MKFRIPCEEANHICDKTQYRDASFWEKIKLNIHLVYCRACREYTARNQKLTKTIHQAKVKTVKKIDKEVLKKQLRQEMNK